MDFRKIDKNFIREIRLTPPIMNYSIFKIDTKEIVPKELTHRYLKENYKIDEKILEYYYAPTQFLNNDIEYNKIIGNDTITTKTDLLEPYSVIIGNAYYSRTDLLTKLKTLISSNYDLICGNKKVEYLSDLLPYFKEYSKGFEHGFKEFDNDQVKLFLTMFPEKNDYLNKVFDFVTKRIFPKHDWVNITRGFKMKSNFETSKYIITGGFEDGKTQGYFYRAWSIIFSSNNLFVPLFKDFLQSKINSQQVTPQPQGRETVMLPVLKHSDAIEKLKKVWLADPKITVEDFIQKGIVKGLWNENLNIITARGSLYGTGKTMLGSIFIAFKGWAISNNIDSKKVGIVFCNVFNVDIKKATNEPYKAFSSGNSKTVTEIRRAFGIQNS
jgi:hypothetical protein